MQHLEVPFSYGNIRSSVLMTHTDFTEDDPSTEEDATLPVNNKYVGIENGMRIFKLYRRFMKA